MIGGIIENTSLTSVAADEFFGDAIRCDRWRGDCSMLAVLRALLPQRMGEKDWVSVCFADSTANISNNSLTVVDTNPDTVPEFTLDLSKIYSFPCKLLRHKKGTAIFCNLTFARLHAIEMVIPAVFPQFFVDSPLSASERELLRSIINPNAEEFLNKLVDIADEYGIPTVC